MPKKYLMVLASYQDWRQEFFEEYMFSWDKPELIEKYSIPEKFQLQDWNELDDLAHLNGPEIMEENTKIVKYLANL